LVEIGLRWLPKLGVDPSLCPNAHSRACIMIKTIRDNIFLELFQFPFLAILPIYNVTLVPPFLTKISHGFWDKRLRQIKGGLNRIIHFTLKSYSPTLMHGKIFVYDFCVL
jgi:hypothetical protein